LVWYDEESIKKKVQEEENKVKQVAKDLTEKVTIDQKATNKEKESKLEVK